jgi:hypothetical protein
MYRVSDSQPMVDAGTDRDSVELPFTTAVFASDETAWKVALNWRLDSKEEKEE